MAKGYKALAGRLPAMLAAGFALLILPTPAAAADPVEVEKLRKELQAALEQAERLKVQLQSKEREADKLKNDLLRALQELKTREAELVRLQEKGREAKRQNKEHQEQQRELDRARQELIQAQRNLAKAQAAAHDRDAARNATHVHVAIFYFKKDVPEGTVEAFMKDAREMLGKIETVRGLWTGTPAEQSKLDFVIRDYQVGLVVLFDDYEGLKKYREHVKHKEFVDKHAKHWEKGPVYDIMTSKPGK